MPRYLLNSSQRPRFRRPNPFAAGAECLYVYSPHLEGSVASEWILGHAAVPSVNVTFQPSGRGDYCSVYNGTDTFLDFPSTNANRIDSQDVTISCWVLFNSTAEQLCMEKGSDLDGSVSYGFGLDTGHHLAMLQGNDFTGNSAFTPTVGQWYHVVIRRRTSATKIDYLVDGGSTYSASFTYTKTPASSTKTLTIGTRGTASIGTTSSRGLHFTGRLGDLRIYLAALPDGAAWSNFAPTQRDVLHQRWRRTGDLVAVFDMPIAHRSMVSLP